MTAPLVRKVVVADVQPRPGRTIDNGRPARSLRAEPEPPRTVDVDGVPFAYRELGASSGVPVVFLHHFTAVLDDWDPRVIDGIAARHRVIASRAATIRTQDLRDLNLTRDLRVGGPSSIGPEPHPNRRPLAT